MGCLIFTFLARGRGEVLNAGCTETILKVKANFLRAEVRAPLLDPCKNRVVEDGFFGGHEDVEDGSGNTVNYAMDGKKLHELLGHNSKGAIQLTLFDLT